MDPPLAPELVSLLDEACVADSAWAKQRTSWIKVGFFSAGVAGFVFMIGVGGSSGFWSQLPASPNQYLQLDGLPRDPAYSILEWLRSQEFNKKTEAALLHHPMVIAAEEGVMPLLAVRLVLLEEYSTEISDLQSMGAALARHGSLGDASREFFLTSSDSEHAAFQKLIDMAKVMNLSEVDLRRYQPMPLAHGYSADLAQLSNYGGAGAIAAAFAVNFPAWGRMCGRIRDAMLKPPYSFSKDGVAFLTYFAEPIPGYDDAATAVITESMASGETAESIRSAVELLQGYEVMFWDAVWGCASSQDGMIACGMNPDFPH